jgi:serine/threonine-protein kinase
VQVSPAGATVDVDGQSAVVIDGALRISGDLGSVHHIRVTSGERSTITDVVITEQGALPSKVALGSAAPRAMSGDAPRGPRPRPTAAQPVAPPAAPAPQPKSTGGFDQKFE